jgi:hypothetical protein
MDNVIGSDFKWNFITGGNFTENNIGNYFMGDEQTQTYQQILNAFYKNRIANQFSLNTIYYVFIHNDIGNEFSLNTIWGFMSNQFANMTSNSSVFGDLSNTVIIQNNVVSPGAHLTGNNYTSFAELLNPHTTYVLQDNGSTNKCYYIDGSNQFQWQTLP